jgi:hypothetical protein
MKTTRRKTNTSLRELTETHNLALSIKRLRESNDSDEWRRALYHALSMNYVNKDTLCRIREALGLA